MRAYLTSTVFAVLLAACSSSSSTPSTPTGDGGGASSGNPPSSSGSGCKVTFGGDAKTVTAKNCTQMGPFTSDATAFEWHGDADGLDDPIYSFTVKYPNGITAKTYETKDIYYVSANMKVTSTNTIYDCDFDSRDASKSRHGSVTTVFSSPEHGTVDLVFESDDTPPKQATVHIEF